MRVARSRFVTVGRMSTSPPLSSCIASRASDCESGLACVRVSPLFDTVVVWYDLSSVYALHTLEMSERSDEPSAYAIMTAAARRMVL